MEVDDASAAGAGGKKRAPSRLDAGRSQRRRISEEEEDDENRQARVEQNGVEEDEDEEALLETERRLQEHEDEDEDDDGDDDSEDERDDQMDEGGYEERKESDLVREQLGPIPKKRKKINPEGLPPETGILTKIYCENFMCHRKLSVSFCPNVNFINGQNGSGKSAILAALQICLGARASVTHRGARLSELIRHGHDGYALLRVTLLNRGSDAFQPDKFGDMITVERKIERSGGGAYRLLRGDPNKPETLQLVSSKRDDLENMLDRFNIQVENPCALLDQENAKKFIGGDSREKYKFFHKATDLERVTTNYLSAKEKLTEARAELEHAREKVHDARNMYNELQKKVEDMEGLSKVEHALKMAKLDNVWAQHRDLKDKLKEQERAVEKERRRVETFEKHKSDYEQTKQSLEQEVLQHEEKFRRLKQDGEDAKTRMKAIKQALGEHRGPLVQAEQLKRSKADEAKDYIRRKREAEKKLDEERQKCMSEAAAEERAAGDKIKQIEIEMTDLAAQMEEATNRLQDVEGRAADLDQQRRRLQDDFNAAKKAYKDWDGHISSLNQNSNGLALYGPRMPQLVADLQRQRDHFRVPPIGPLGHYIKVKDDQRDWTIAIENALGGLLTSFLVTCKEDREKLAGSLRRHGVRSSITTMALSARIASPRDPPGLLSVASCIQVEHDNVWNTLMTWGGIEYNGLCRTVRDAEKALVTDNRGCLAFPGKISSVYFPDNYQMRVKDSNKNIFHTGRKNDLQKRLGVDTQAALVEAQQMKANAAQEVDRLHQEMRLLQDHAGTINQERPKLKDQLARLRSRENRLKVTKAELHQTIFESQAAANTEVDLSDLEREIETYDSRMKEAQAQHKDIEKRVSELKKELEPLQAEEKMEHNRNQQIKEELEAMENESERLLKKIDFAEGAVKKAERAIKDQERVIRSKEAERDQTVAKVEEQRPMLAQVTRNDKPDWDGEDIVPEDSLEVIKRRILKLEKKLAAERQQHETTDSLEVVKEKCNRAKQTWSALLKAWSRIDANTRLLQAGFKERRKKAVAVRKAISRNANRKFDDTLQYRGQSGQLLFNHNEQTLELTVQKDNRDEATQSSNVKELSGGEGSFSTLALLLALGESIESPFRVSDEFDVFMDSIARNTALQLLLKAAMAMSNRQFIFITPQNLDSIKADGQKVRIHKLRPPERMHGNHQQTTL